MQSYSAWMRWSGTWASEEFTRPARHVFWFPALRWRISPALAVVVLVQIILFAGFHRERWRKSLIPLGRPAALAGEGLVIRCDGLGYYAWLRSLLIDGDWLFDNEFDEHNVIGDWVPPPDSRSRIGRRTNQWSVGPACLWAITVIPTHACMLALHAADRPWPCDGYSLPYQLVVGVTTLLLSIVGFVFLYFACRRYADPGPAALAVAFLVLGSTVIFYAAIEVTMAHSVGPAVVAALIWFWLKTYGSNGWQRWMLVGTLVGLAGLMRWQLVTFAYLPVGEALLEVLHARKVLRSSALLLVSGACAGVVFMPQIIAWRLVYGQWFVTPITVSHNWLNPSWGCVLWSQDRGLFSWTPITLLACMGFAFCGRRVNGDSRSRESLLILFGAFVAQVYVIASLWGEDVQLGVSYGLRHLTESVMLLAPGLAMLLQRVSAARFRWLCGLGCLLVLWNLLVIAQYRYGWIPAAGSVDLATLLCNVPHLIVRKKFLLVGQVLLGPVLLLALSRGVTTRCSGAASRSPELIPSLPEL